MAFWAFLAAKRCPGESPLRLAGGAARLGAPACAAPSAFGAESSAPGSGVMRSESFGSGSRLLSSPMIAARHQVLLGAKCAEKRGRIYLPPPLSQRRLALGNK